MQVLKIPYPMSALQAKPVQVLQKLQPAYIYMYYWGLTFVWAWKQKYSQWKRWLVIVAVYSGALQYSWEVKKS